MEGLVYIVTGMIVGTLGSICSFYLGGRLVKATYSELTNPHIEDTVDKKDNNKPTTEAYNWEEYDQYLQQDDNQA